MTWLQPQQVHLQSRIGFIHRDNGKDDLGGFLVEIMNEGGHVAAGCYIRDGHEVANIDWSD